MITVSFFFYIRVRLIDTLIPKPGPRFIAQIIFVVCIVHISCISSTKLAVIFSELRQVRKQANL